VRRENATEHGVDDDSSSITSADDAASEGVEELQQVALGWGDETVPERDRANSEQNISISDVDDRERVCLTAIVVGVRDGVTGELISDVKS